jgi:hypothetical protein
MKQRLEETAAATGRSQSQEVELRLDRSFDREDLLPDVLSLAFDGDDRPLPAGHLGAHGRRHRAVARVDLCKKVAEGNVPIGNFPVVRIAETGDRLADNLAVLAPRQHNRRIARCGGDWRSERWAR